MPRLAPGWSPRCWPRSILPMNDRTGTNVGVRAQLHFYLDDLFPRSLGRPLFGN